jgi:hypothetical protein
MAAAGGHAEFFKFEKPDRAGPEMVTAGFLYLDAEDFDSYGGWRMDTQFVHLMGSPFLMATGVGKPVDDALTTIAIPCAGEYRVWVRARNWVQSHAPGRFQVALNGTPLEHEFGAAPTDRWTWENGGTVFLRQGEAQVALHDLTGFYGRCDAILLTTDADYVPPEETEAVCKERARLLGLSPEPAFAGRFDVIVVGAGSAGVPAALAAARNGAKTALIQNRPVLGGNSSLECGVGVNGAGGNHPGWRESGIIEEAGWIRADLDQINYSEAFKRLCDAEENLTVFLNQHVIDAVMENAETIAGVKAVSTLTGLISEYAGTQFIDCSGDGWLGFYAGAEFRHGREASSEFNEALAPETPDEITMSGCIMGDDLGYMTAFRSQKTDRPVEFVRPEWVREIDTLESPHRTLKDVPGVGTWWMEHPGDIDDALHAEEARDELIKVTLAFWDYVKNKSPFIEKAEPYELVRIPILDAKRESRRLVGDTIVNQNDVEAGRLFPDRIAYAGWDLDIHHPEGIYSGEGGSLDFKNHVPLSSVPFRSIYSKNIDNLLMAGRCLSYTHVALGTVRVQSTLATIGQAAGTAAAMCADKQIHPRELGRRHIAELQQELLKDDQTIQGIRNEDPNDLARAARVSASSYDKNGDDGDVSFVKSISLDRVRSAVIPKKGLQTLDEFYLYLESKSPVPVNIPVQISALEHFAPQGPSEPIGQCSVALPANSKGWITVPVAAALPADTQFLKITLPAVSKVGWPIMAAPGGPGGRTYDDKTVSGEFHALTIDPRPAPVGCPPQNVINGWTRTAQNASSMWRSDPAQPLPQWIELDFEHPVELNTVQLTFVTDPAGQRPRLPFSETCVKDYELSVFADGEWKTVVRERDNFQRHRVHQFKVQKAAKLRLTVSAAHGAPAAEVFEIRAYNERPSRLLSRR